MEKYYSLNTTNTNEQCSICLEDLQHSKDVVAHSTRGGVSQLIHPGHTICIQKWIEASLKDRRQACCPLCRKKISYWSSPGLNMNQTNNAILSGAISAIFTSMIVASRFRLWHPTESNLYFCYGMLGCGAIVSRQGAFGGVIMGLLTTIPIMKSKIDPSWGILTIMGTGALAGSLANTIYQIFQNRRLTN